MTSRSLRWRRRLRRVVDGRRNRFFWGCLGVSSLLLFAYTEYDLPGAVGGVGVIGFFGGLFLLAFSSSDVCPSCGGGVNVHDHYCPSCGGSLEDVPVRPIEHPDADDVDSEVGA